MIKILKKLYDIIPDSLLKNKLQCFYFNHIREYNGFHIKYIKNYFVIILPNGCELKYYQNQYSAFRGPIRGYIKNHHLRSGDIVIDAGAYIGEFTIYAAKIVGPTGKVIAFEPDKKNYKLLIENISLNKLDNIVVLNKGLWNQNTNLKFMSDANASSIRFSNEESNEIGLEVVKLDDELNKLKINTVNFIKMDIEGAEIEAIKGAENILKNNDIYLAIASYHLRNNIKTCELLEPILNRLDYFVITEFPEHLTTYAWPKKN